ncbi:putative PurR-regulated permease PerM [Arthrobacter roseus]|nr:putative PurR-regulated permease PerM [Arthrobacter roseus]
MRRPNSRQNSPLAFQRSMAKASSENASEDVPYALRVSAAWAWRLGLILVVSGILIWLLSKVSLIIIPLMVAGLLAGLLSPVTEAMRRNRVPGSLAVTITVLGFLGIIVGGLSLVGQELVRGFSDLRDEAIEGVNKVERWLSDGPLHLTTDQIGNYAKDIGEAAQSNSSTIVSGALSFGSTAGQLAAGSLLTVFALIFFLLEGNRIWGFAVGLMPRKARAATDGAGRKGWVSMVHYVRTQIFVAFVDAVGIGAGAAIIGVPLALPLSVLVFIGSFIPIVGALFTGFLVVVLALVANGWVNALIMLAIVLVVQQIEGHILQPLVIGKAVALHPLAVVLAVAAGSLLAGIPGALFSVPLLAIVNTMVRYIATRQWESDPALGAPPSRAELIQDNHNEATP